MCQSSEENLGFRYQYWNLMSYSVWVEENLTKHSSNTLMHLVRFIATQTFYSWCVINSEKWNFTIQKLPIFWRFWPLDQAGSWQIDHRGETKHAGILSFHGFMNITGGRPGLWQYWLWSLNSNIKKKTVYILKCNDGKTWKIWKLKSNKSVLKKKSGQFYYFIIIKHFLWLIKFFQHEIIVY